MYVQNKKSLGVDGPGDFFISEGLFVLLCSLIQLQQLIVFNG